MLGKAEEDSRDVRAEVGYTVSDLKATCLCNRGSHCHYHYIGSEDTSAVLELLQVYQIAE